MRILSPEQYQPIANTVFQALATEISTAIPNADVEHIGSSAISSLLSKGDLDIYVAVELSDFIEAIDALQRLGFRIKLDSLRTDSLCPFEGDGYPLDVGIQLVARGSKFEFFLTFRDLLISNPYLREEYNRLKQACSSLDQDRYRAIKSEFIEQVLRDNVSDLP